MASLNAYLMFDGNCREAMEFYKSCLGGELVLNSMGEAPGSEELRKEMRNNIMHSMLTSGKITLMASDTMDPGNVKQGNSVSLCLICESREEIDTLYAKFAEGGNPEQPLVDAFFGRYGHLTDKFGQRWMFQFGTGEMK